MQIEEWESGTIRVPKMYWSELKKSVRDAWDVEVLESYRILLEIYEELLRRGKGKHHFNYRREFKAIMRERGRCYPIELMFPDASRKKPLKPKKKQFLKSNLRKVDFSCSLARIYFDNETRSVSWFVFIGKNAIEQARAHPISVALFEVLERIEWTSKTGGIFIRGFSDHNSDDFISQRYGGIGRRTREL